MIFRRVCLALAVAILSVAVGACTSETSAPRREVEARIDPKADEVLKRMCDALCAARAFSFEVHSDMDVGLETGQLVQLHRHSKVVAVRPDKLHVVTEGDNVSDTAWYDGRTLTLLNGHAGTYAAIDAPDRLEAMLDHVIKQYGLTVPLADLFFPNLYEVLTEHTLSGVYVGLHSVDGQPCHHLAFRQEMIDWQVWIDAGEHAVPRKLVITYTREPGFPHYAAVLENWDLAAKPPAGVFAFRPPPGTKQIEMSELVGLVEGGKP